MNHVIIFCLIFFLINTSGSLKRYYLNEEYPEYKLAYQHTANLTLVGGGGGGSKENAGGGGGGVITAIYLVGPLIFKLGSWGSGGDINKNGGDMIINVFNDDNPPVWEVTYIGGGGKGGDGQQGGDGGNSYQISWKNLTAHGGSGGSGLNLNGRDGDIVRTSNNGMLYGGGGGGGANGQEGGDGGSGYERGNIHNDTEAGGGGSFGMMGMGGDGWQKGNDGIAYLDL